MITAAGSGGPTSMRFSLHEVMSGMLASMENDSFPDDPARLAAMFEELAGKFALFAPLGAGVDPAAVGAALKTLTGNKILEHREGRYHLTESGRAYCASGKRTLFNARDAKQLEEAALVFNTL